MIKITEKTINTTAWVLSGSSATLLILAIITTSPMYWAIGFCMLMCGILVYYSYSFIVGKGIPDDVVITDNEQEEYQGEISRNYHQGHEALIPNIMTNSEITAACIKVGITDPEDIAWCQIVNNNSQLVLSRIEIMKTRYNHQSRKHNRQ